MSTPAEMKKRMGVKPPQGATSWALWKIDGNKRVQVRGEALEDGSVPDTWPVSEFSTAKVLAAWGEGRYRVDWYDNGGSYMKGVAQHFEVATPASRGGPKLKSPRGMHAPATAAATIDAPAPAAPLPPSGGGQLGLLEILTLLKQTSDEASERERASSERTMQMIMGMQQQQTQLFAAILAKPGGSGDLDLIRRELTQTLREEQFKMRQQIAANAAIEDEPEGDEPDGPPQDIDEAVSRIGTAVLSDLEQRAPDFVQQAVPKLASWLQRQIGTPAAARVATPPNGHANGS